MGLFDQLKKALSTPQQEPVQDRTLKSETFRAVGVNYYTENIGKLANRNPDWKYTESQSAAVRMAGTELEERPIPGKAITMGGDL